MTSDPSEGALNDWVNAMNKVEALEEKNERLRVEIKRLRQYNEVQAKENYHRILRTFALEKALNDENERLHAALSASGQGERLFADPVQRPIECAIIEGEHYPKAPIGHIRLRVPGWVFGAGLVRLSAIVSVSFPPSPPAPAKGEGKP